MKYINKISGPLLDRIDIHIEVPPVNPSFKGHSNGETSDIIRERVNKARDIQTERFKSDDIHCTPIWKTAISESIAIPCPKPRSCSTWR